MKVNIETCCIGSKVARVWCNSNTNTHTWCTTSQQDPDWVLTYKDSKLSIRFKHIQHAQSFVEYVDGAFAEDIKSCISSKKSSPRGGSYNV